MDPRIAIFKQSETYSFLNQLFFNEGQSLVQMCQELVMSCERVQEIIQHLNTKLPQHYGISIQLSPLVMEGEEEGIRAFYLDYFSQSYSFLDWPFPSISEETLTHLIQLFLKAQQVSPNLSGLRQIKCTLAINLERFNKNHFIENPSPLLTSHYSSLMQIPQFEQDIKKLAKKLHFEATKETLEQLFSNPVKSPQITNNPSNGVLGDIQHIQKSYRLLSQILEELAKEFHLQIENREELIWLLHYTAQSDFFHLLSNQSLDRQKSQILSSYQVEFPKLFEVSQHKFQSYLTEMGLENHPSKLQELVYTFSIQGQRILVQLLQKLPKIRVLVISHLDSHHAQTLSTPLLTTAIISISLILGKNLRFLSQFSIKFLTILLSLPFLSPTLLNHLSTIVTSLLQNYFITFTCWLLKFIKKDWLNRNKICCDFFFYFNFRKTLASYFTKCYTDDRNLLIGESL